MSYIKNVPKNPGDDIDPSKDGRQVNAKYPSPEIISYHYVRDEGPYSYQVQASTGKTYADYLQELNSHRIKRGTTDGK